MDLRVNYPIPNKAHKPTEQNGDGCLELEPLPLNKLVIAMTSHRPRLAPFLASAPTCPISIHHQSNGSCIDASDWKSLGDGEAEEKNS